MQKSHMRRVRLLRKLSILCSLFYLFFLLIVPTLPRLWFDLSSQFNQHGMEQFKETVQN
jgi:hypothetical protein